MRMVIYVLALLGWGEILPADTGWYTAVSPVVFEETRSTFDVPGVGPLVLHPLPTHTKPDTLAGVVGYRYGFGRSNWYAGPLLAYYEHFTPVGTQTRSGPSLEFEPAVGAFGGEVGYGGEDTTGYLRFGGAVVDAKIVTPMANDLLVTDTSYELVTFVSLGIEHTFANDLMIAAEVLAVDYGPAIPRLLREPNEQVSVAIALLWRF